MGKFRRLKKTKILRLLRCCFSCIRQVAVAVLHNSTSACLFERERIANVNRVSPKSHSAFALAQASKDVHSKITLTLRVLHRMRIRNRELFLLLIQNLVSLSLCLFFVFVFYCMLCVFRSMGLVPEINLIDFFDLITLQVTSPLDSACPML